VGHPPPLHPRISPLHVSQLAGLPGLIGMRLFLIGANGRTGTEIIDLARARGHEITAFVRSPEKITPAKSLMVVRGDPLRSEAIAAALPGHDAVLSVIGPHTREAFRPSTLVADCARATVQAMAAGPRVSPLSPDSEAWGNYFVRLVTSSAEISAC
jgi:uncharacterized protein YbjT (DUF2867 family)